MPWKESCVMDERKRFVLKALAPKSCMAALCRAGRTLEIGGGSGNLKAFAPDVVSTDVLAADWLDAACDAQRLPFADDSFDNIVMLDVLHHLQRPVRFFEAATRVLLAATLNVPNDGHRREWPASCGSFGPIAQR